MSDFKNLLTKYLEENTYLKGHKVVKVSSLRIRDGWLVKAEYFPSWGDNDQEYPDENEFEVDFEDLLSWMYFK